MSASPKDFFRLHTRNPFALHFALAGLVQGVALYFLGENLHLVADRSKDLLLTDPRMITGCFLFFAGFAYFLCFVPARALRAGVVALLFGAMQAALWTMFFSVYEGASPFMLSLAYCTAAMILCYVAMPFMQIYVATKQLSFSYESLFQHAWNNAQITLTSYILAGLFFGIIALCSGLLGVVTISVFWEIFTSRWFYIPAFFTVKAVGYAMARDNEAIVASLRRINLSFCRFLSPILSIFGIIFAVGLIASGFTPLWKTGHGSTLLLWFIFLSVLFFNSLFQDGTRDSYFEGLLGRIQRVALVLLPFFAGCVVYGITTRIAQYGLSPHRYYSLLLALFAGAYAALYAVAAFLPLEKMRAAVMRGNIIIAFGIIGACILVQIPPISAATLSAQDQYRLLASGRIAPEKFDFYNLRWNLGLPGKKLFAALRENPMTATPAIREHIEAAEKKQYGRHRAAENPLPDSELRDMASYMIVHLAPPPALVTKMLADTRSALSMCRMKTMGRGCALIPADIDRDGKNEFIFIAGYNITAYKETNGAWAPVASNGFLRLQPGHARDALESMLTTVKVVPAPFDEIELSGGAKIVFNR